MPIRVVVALAVVGLLGVVVVQSSRNAARLPSAFSGTPATPQPAKQILGSLEHEWQNGDILYVSRKSEFAFRYYLTCKDCNAQSADQFRLWPFQPIGGPSQSSAAIVPQRPNLILGSSDSDLSLVVQDFERLRGKPRVWLLFTDSGGLDLNTLEFWLDHEGRQLQAIRSGAAAAFLYDLRRPAT
jgi:hypothetical protein